MTAKIGEERKKKAQAEAEEQEKWQE